MHEIVVGAGEVAAGPLQLDDAGTAVGEAGRQERRCDRLFEADDEESVEGTGHSETSPVLTPGSMAAGKCPCLPGSPRLRNIPAGRSRGKRRSPAEIGRASCRERGWQYV